MATQANSSDATLNIVHSQVWENDASMITLVFLDDRSEIGKYHSKGVPAGFQGPGHYLVKRYGLKTSKQGGLSIRLLELERIG